MIIGCRLLDTDEIGEKLTSIHWFIDAFFQVAWVTKIGNCRADYMLGVDFSMFCYKLHA